MAIIEGSSWGRYGQEIAGSLGAGVRVWGSMAEYAAKKTEPTREAMKEAFWYEVGKVTKRVKTQYVRPMRRWLR
jgi:hypothetical protein